MRPLDADMHQSPIFFPAAVLGALDGLVSVASLMIGQLIAHSRVAMGKDTVHDRRAS